MSFSHLTKGKHSLYIYMSAVSSEQLVASRCSPALALIKSFLVVKVYGLCSHGVTFASLRPLGYEKNVQ
jgi:hypothetical protein